MDPVNIGWIILVIALIPMWLAGIACIAAMWYAAYQYIVHGKIV